MTLALAMMFQIQHEKHNPLKKKIDKSEIIKSKKKKKNCSVKDTVRRIKSHDWEKIFIKHICDKGLIPKIHKNC